jgi:CheY-like chemotaxis protein
MWLLAEDDSDIRMVVAMMMTVWGENPLPFPDGKSVWAWLDSVENGTFSGPLPDLALMDIRMPGYTGDQIAARMRNIESLKDIPIILMTAFSMSDAEIAALRERCGIDHLLEKPLPDLDVFRTLLYKVRDERRQTQKGSATEPAPHSIPAPDSIPTPEPPSAEPHNVAENLAPPAPGQDATPQSAPDATTEGPTESPAQPQAPVLPQTDS